MGKGMMRPRLTFGDAEAAALRDAYENAEVILEYGSGGSTVLAAEMEGKSVFAVESDRSWSDAMSAYLAGNPQPSSVTMHYADVGETGKWGRPANEDARDRWPAYAASVWDLPEFRHPDVVLVDGRFRVACFLQTVKRISRPVTLLFDDYAGRKKYHRVEDLAGAPRMHGRLAQFALSPVAFTDAQNGWLETAGYDTA